MRQAKMLSDQTNVLVNTDSLCLTTLIYELNWNVLLADWFDKSFWQKKKYEEKKKEL